MVAGVVVVLLLQPCTVDWWAGQEVLEVLAQLSDARWGELPLQHVFVGRYWDLVWWGGSLLLHFWWRCVRARVAELE